MTATFQLNTTLITGFDEKPGYYEHLNRIFETTLHEIDRVLYRYMFFNLAFLTLLISETLIFFSLFTFLVQSFLFALGLATLFFTIFSYFTLRIYFQTKKPEQLNLIKNRYLHACKALLKDMEESSEKHASLANACCKLANRLHAREYTYYKAPTALQKYTPFLENISCRLHWKEIHFIKELLLQESVNEHIKLVKTQPTSLEAHASLANAYVMLSGLYINPHHLEGYDNDRWIPFEKYNEVFHEKFRFTAERAIEEFKILEEYAPDDPWVHSQLAYSYHDLQMPLEEIQEYEIIQKLIPDDMDNLCTLGKLYFQQGMNAKGLRVYEELIHAEYDKAESLIRCYGSSI